MMSSTLSRSGVRKLLSRWLTENPVDVLRFKQLVGFAMTLLIIATIPLCAARAQNGDRLQIGLVTFLSGPGANLAISTRNAAELIIDSINEGSLPAPYRSPGIAGAQVETVFIDEAGSSTRVVTETRNLVGRREIDLLVGYLTAGHCYAVAPVADELKTLTVFTNCAAPVFEEHEFEYVFQTLNQAGVASVTLARFINRHYPNATKFAAINPNYAWGRDAWRTFLASMRVFVPDLEVKTALWPKLFSGQFGVEITALLQSKADVVHVGLWGPDLEAFVIQAAQRGLFEQSHVAFATGLQVLPAVKDNLPDGTIVTTYGGLAGRLMPQTELSQWFHGSYIKRFGSEPGVHATYFANALLGVKAAYEKAAATVGRFPTQEEVIDAFEYLEFESLSGTISMANGNGHQAILDSAIGFSKYDPNIDEVQLIDVTTYDAECVNPPPAWKSEDWMAAGFPGAKCD